MKKTNYIFLGVIAVLLIIIGVLLTSQKNDSGLKIYRVTFDSNGGSSIDSQVVEDGKKVVKPEDPEKEGSIFVEWTLDDKTYNFKTPVLKDIKLVAKWQDAKPGVEYVAVKYVLDDNDSSTYMMIKGDVLEVPEVPVKTGYKFVEWQLNGEKYDFSKPVDEDIELKAVWEKTVVENEPSVVKYSVSFDTAGGSSVRNQMVVEGNKVVKPTNPTKSGYTFVEWQLNGKTYDFNTKVTGSIRLVAIWKEAEVVKYTVTFDTKGGNSIDSQEIVSGNKVTKPSNPTRNGYLFDGWYLNDRAYDFSSAVTGNITLTAKWKENSYVVKVTLAADDYSPERTLTLYENGNKTTFKSIRYENGDIITTKDHVNKNIIASLTKVKVELNDGTIVTAVLEK